MFTGYKARLNMVQARHNSHHGQQNTWYWCIFSIWAVTVWLIMDAQTAEAVLPRIQEKAVLAPNGECVLWTGTVKSGRYGILNIKIVPRWKVFVCP